MRNFLGVLVLLSVLLPAAQWPVEIARAQDPSDIELPALISADRVTYDENLETVTATGHVEISQGERVLLADTVSYNLRTDVVTASGNVSLLEPSGEVVFADFVELTGDLREGFVRDIRVLLSDRSRMAAASGTRIDGNKTVLYNAVFSPCDLCQDDPTKAPLWQIRASRVIHDQEEKVIAYRDARMEIFGIPIAYTPYFEHPDPTVKRKSGFLAPTIGSSEVLGVTAQIPYFWAIAPDRDVTFEPIFTTKQSVVLAGEYRQLLPDGELNLSGSGTIADRTESSGEIDENVVRGAIDSEGRFDINETWRWGFDLERSTDDTYLRLYNFSGARTLTSAAFIEGFRGRNYLSVNNFLYQGLRDEDDNDQAPIIFPTLDYSYVSQPGIAGGRYTFDGNMLLLSRLEGRESRRISLKGGWQLPYISPIGDQYKLSVEVQADGYWVLDFNPSRPNDVAPTSNQEEFLTGRFFPQLALEWSYPWVSNTADFGQVIEPIVQAVVAPDGSNPDDIPNEDSQDFEFDDSNLFSLNRFPGRDRVDSGTRFDYGIKWKLVSGDFGHSNAFFGQSYRLNKNDDFGNDSGVEDNFSDFVGRVLIRPVDYIDMIYRFRLDKDNLAPRRSEVDARLGPPALNMQVSYLDASRESDLLESQGREELSVQLNTKLSENWSAFASHRRNLITDSSLVTQGGLTYQDECFLIQAIASRSFFSDREIEPEDSIFLRVVFKHLGEVASR